MRHWPASLWEVFRSWSRLEKCRILSVSSSYNEVRYDVSGLIEEKCSFGPYIGTIIRKIKIKKWWENMWKTLCSLQDLPWKFQKARQQCVDGAIKETIHAKQCKGRLSDDLHVAWDWDPRNKWKWTCWHLSGVSFRLMLKHRWWHKILEAEETQNKSTAWGCPNGLQVLPNEATSHSIRIECLSCLPMPTWDVIARMWWNR